MATRIPAKQLQTYGTLAELKDRLLETETGWCTDDNILYYNDGGTLKPVTKVVVIKENTSREDIAAIISAGCVPVVKLDLQGTVYLYPVHIRGNDAYTFASPISIGSGNTKDGYYWAIVAANGTWSTGFKEIVGSGGDCNAVLFECTELGGTFDGPSFDDLEAARSGGKTIALLVHTGRDTVQDSYFVFDYYGSGRGSFHYNFVNLTDRDMLVFGGRTGDATSYKWSHATAIFAPGAALEFGSDRVLNVQAGKGLAINSETNALDVIIDPSSLEIVDGVITIKKEIVDVTGEMVELLDDMDSKITSTFPFAHITKTYDFVVSGHRNGNVMIGQLFLCPVAQELRADGDCPTFLSVYVGDTVYGGDICLGLYEFDPDANNGSGSTYWLCDTGPVKLKSGVNHFPIKYLMAPTTDRPKIKMESGKYYYAVLAIRTTGDPGQPANGLYMAGGDPYTTWFNSAIPAISQIEQNIATTGTGPVIDWSGNASTLENAWFKSHEEARDIPRLFMLVSNRKIGEAPPSEGPFPDYSDNYTLAHTNELGDLFACNKVSNWGNAIVMQRVTPAKNITVHKITYIDMHNYPGPNEYWDGAPTPLILDGSTYASIRSRSDANITRGNKDGATIDGTHYLHEYTLTSDFVMAAGTSYWVAAMLGCNNPGQDTPVVEFTAPADAASKDLLLVGDFYNPAQSATNELQNDVGKTVCIIEDADGNRYMF